MKWSLYNKGSIINPLYNPTTTTRGPFFHCSHPKTLPFTMCHQVAWRVATPTTGVAKRAETKNRRQKKVRWRIGRIPRMDGDIHYIKAAAGFCLLSICIHIWLVVSTPSKNISQNGNLPQIGMKIKNVWNHHPDIIVIHLWYIYMLLVIHAGE